MPERTGRKRPDGSPEQPVKVTACVGAYLAKGEDLTFDSVFGQAAAALYAAKNNGRGEYCVLTGETEEKQKESLSKPVNAVPMNTLLEYLDAKPLLNLGLRLGEGSGSVCAYPILDSAIRMINEMDNFAHASIIKYF